MAAAPALGAADWDRRYAERELLWTAQPNRFVVEATAQLPPGRALDVAAGEGRNAVWLAGRGWVVTAVDFSRVGLDKGRRLAERHGVAVEWVEADLRRWVAPLAAFDLVLVAYLHAGADVLDKVLREGAAALAPGGTLVVVGHDRDNAERGHGGPPDPRLLYTTGQVTRPLTDLEVVRAGQVTRPVELDGGATATAIDTLVVARREPAAPSVP